MSLNTLSESKNFFANTKIFPSCFVNLKYTLLSICFNWQYSLFQILSFFIIPSFVLYFFPEKKKKQKKLTTCMIHNCAKIHHECILSKIQIFLSDWIVIIYLLKIHIPTSINKNSSLFSY